MRRHILDLAHVREIHDLHAGQIAPGLPVLIPHVVVDVVDDECFHDGHVPVLVADL